MSRPRKKLKERFKSANAKVDYVSHISVFLSDDPVATTTQALHDNSFTPFTGVNGTSRTACKRTYDGPAQSIAIVIDLTKNRTGTCAQDSGPTCFPIELALITRE